MVYFRNSLIALASLGLIGIKTSATFSQEAASFSGVPKVTVMGTDLESCLRACDLERERLQSLGLKILKTDSCHTKYVDIDNWGRGYRLACQISFIN